MTEEERKKYEENREKKETEKHSKLDEMMDKYNQNTGKLYIESLFGFGENILSYGKIF